MLTRLPVGLVLCILMLVPMSVHALQAPRPTVIILSPITETLSVPNPGDPLGTTCIGRFDYVIDTGTTQDSWRSISIFLQPPVGTRIQVTRVELPPGTLRYTSNVRIPVTGVGNYIVTVSATTVGGQTVSDTWSDFYCVDVQLQVSECINGIVSVTYSARTGSDRPFRAGSVRLYIDYLQFPNRPPVDNIDEDVTSPILFRGSWSSQDNSQLLDDGQHEVRVIVDSGAPGRLFTRVRTIFCNIDPSGVGGAQYRP